MPYYDVEVYEISTCTYRRVKADTPAQALINYRNGVMDDGGPEFVELADSRGATLQELADDLDLTEAEFAAQCDAADISYDSRGGDDIVPTIASINLSDD